MRHFITQLLVLSTLLISAPSWAAKVTSVSGKNVELDIGKEKYKVGDVLKIENASGKTVGLAKIKSIKGTQATALLKGKAQAGLKATLRPAAKATSSKAAAQPTAPAYEPKTSSMLMGFMLGYGMSSADVKLSASTVSLDGTGFSLKGFLDYPIFDSISFRGMAGLEQFNIGGTNNNDCSGECKAEINYLALDGWARYLFGSSGMRPWAGLGASFMFTVSKDSTALAESSISNSSLLSVGGGLDFYTASKNVIPVQIEYNMYPSTEKVDASTISLRVGYGF